MSSDHTGPDLLTLEAVTKVHVQGAVQVHALRGVDLALRPGELVAVMGPSGSGKSTLLHLAGGLDTPTAGSVVLDGVSLAGMSARARAALRRRTVGYVFQDLNLLPALTAAENVVLPRELDGMPTRQARREAREALAAVDVEDLADRYPDEMSGGQQQRVAIARALVGPRRIVLADEPTGAVDTTNGEQILRLLRERVDAGAAALLVTHEARHAAWADRVVPAGRARGRRRRAAGRTRDTPRRTGGGRAMTGSFAPMVPGRVSRWRALLGIARRDARRHLGLDLAGLVAVGTLTALAAAVLPARRAARLDVLAALTGRRGSPPPHAAVPLTGLVLAVVGDAVAVIGSRHRSGMTVLLGVAGSVVGLLLMSGGIVALTARAAHLMPPAPRLALRDALRNRGRTAPAVAAVMAAVAGGVGVLLYTAANDEQARRAYVAPTLPGTAIVTLTQPVDLGAAPVSRDRQQRLDATVRTVADAARRGIPGTAAVPVRLAGSPDGFVSAVPTPADACPVPPEDHLPAEQAAGYEKDPRCQDQQLPGQVGVDQRPLVDDGTALRLLTGSDAARTALAAGRVVVFDDALLWPDGRVHLSVVRNSDQAPQAPRPTPGDAFPATVVHLEHPYSAPVLPPSVAARAKLPVTVGSVLLDTRAISQTAEERATAAVLDSGLGALQVEHGYRYEYTPGLIALTVAMVVIAFVGTITAVGLALAEGRTDAMAYAAVGASPGLRRRLAAAQAAVISLLGGLAGVAGGLLVGYVMGNMTDLSVDVADPPVGLGSELATAWPYLVVLALGPVLMALAASFVFTRTSLPLPRRVNA